jgi:hypothetical protein
MLVTDRALITQKLVNYTLGHFSNLHLSNAILGERKTHAVLGYILKASPLIAPSSTMLRYILQSSAHSKFSMQTSVPAKPLELVVQLVFSYRPRRPNLPLGVQLRA